MHQQDSFFDLTDRDLAEVSGGYDVNVFGETPEEVRYAQWLEDYPYRLQSLGIAPSGAPFATAPSAVAPGPVNSELWERMMEQRIEDAYFYRLDNY